MFLSPTDPRIERFRRSVEQIAGAQAATANFGVAVSGGPDSVALLLLAAAAMPGRVRAATVDHAIRPGSAAEAEMVARMCTDLDVPHDTLTLTWAAPTANRQARAREARYGTLARWALDHDLRFLATAHHLDDQAETLLMRLDRGAGVGGLAGIRVRRHLLRRGRDPSQGQQDQQDVDLIRPLLFWRRSELAELVAASGADSIDDPANGDPAHDRTRARAFLEASPHWPDRLRLAASALYLGEADRALDWAAAQIGIARERPHGGGYVLDVTGVPPELCRRMVRNLILTLQPEQDEPRGDVLTRALEQLRQGRVATLSGVIIRPSGSEWQLERAPPRRLSQAESA